jgi:hypothetical protein
MSEPDAAPESRGYSPWVERWLMPFVYEPTLWPVLLVLVGHAAAFGTALLLLGLRDRSPPALLALVLLAVMSVQVLRYELACRGRPAALSGVLGAGWLVSGALAWVADRYDVF